MRAATFTASDDRFLREIGASESRAAASTEEAGLRQQLAVLEEHARIACALWTEEIGISARWRRVAFASFTGNVVLAFLAVIAFLWGWLK